LQCTPILADCPFAQVDDNQAVIDDGEWFIF